MTLTRSEPLVVEVPGARVQIVVSRRCDGDFHLDPARTDPGARRALEIRRRALVDLAWTQPDEVHGCTVVVVEKPGGCDLDVGDAVVTALDDAVIGIWTADCAPVALIGDNGVIAGVHAGWRGIMAGVLERSLEALRDRGAHEVRAVLGPCIHSCCYEFGTADLEAIAGAYGASVRSADSDGRPALDMPALVSAALHRSGVAQFDDRSLCTGCHPDQFFSHRVRAERERQVMAIWRSAR